MAGELNYTLSSSPNASLNTYDTILSLSQNPAFLLQEGLITPEAMLRYVQSAINEPVLKPNDYDVEGYRASVPTANTRLQGAFDLIDAGMTTSQVVAKLYEDIAEERNGELLPVDTQVVEQYRTDIEEYARRLKNSEEKNSRIANGEWFEDATGIVYGTSDDARQILSSMDFTGIAGVPQMWNPILDPTAKAMADEQLAGAEVARQKYITKGKQAAKETGSVAKGVYEEFLKKTPGGQLVLETVSPKKKQEQGMDGKKVAAYLAARTLGVPVDAAMLGKKVIQAMGGTSVGDTAKKLKEAQNQDYWAKLAASYAGRAAQEASGTQKQAASERQKATDLFNQYQTSMEQARTNAQTPALQALMSAPSVAASMAQTAPRATGKPAPRVLSDAEIELMSNMIAGGMQ